MVLSLKRLQDNYRPVMVLYIHDTYFCLSQVSVFVFSIDWIFLHCLLQAVIQLIGAVYTVLSTSKEPDRLAMSAIAVGFGSLIIGELGA